MKPVFLLVTFLFALSAISQEGSAKEKANFIAKNESSKSKYKREERFGIVKEKNKVIESTPIINSNLSFYSGTYVCEGRHDTIFINADAQNNLSALLHPNGSTPLALKNITITDALFQAVKRNEDGAEELWEGVFINKKDGDMEEFGLGIKLPATVKLTEGQSTTKLFFKKLLP